MPVYNCENYINEAIESILTQTFSNFELIIIDDASTDSTVKFIKSYADKRIVLFEKKTNSGYSESLNFGLTIAKGENIARMDGDDISHKTRFEKQISILDNSKKIVLCGTWMEILDSGKLIIFPIEHDEINVCLLKHCCIAHPTVMLRMSFLVEHSLTYNTLMEPAEDYDLWIRMVRKGVFAIIPEKLLKYRMHNQQTSIVKQNIQKQKTFLIKVIHLSTIINISVAKKFYSVQDIINLKSTKKKIAYLNWILKECEYLKYRNNTILFFESEHFNSFLEDHKKTVNRYIFLSSSSHDPMLLFYFGKTIMKNRNYFKLFEVLKNIIKCIFFYNRSFTLY